MSPQSPIPCKFHHLGTCRAGDQCPYAHSIKSYKSLVCQYYLAGNCKYGSQCALSHQKSIGTPSKKTSQGLQLKPVKENAQDSTKIITKTMDSIKLITETMENVHLEPLCPFALQGQCRYAEKCKYLHGLQCPHCLKYCLHPNASTEQHEEHKTKCLEKKNSLLHNEEEKEASKKMECVICMETVMSKADPRFGLLNCPHCVCLSCIRSWRTNERMDTSKTCPICREVTHFVVPSSVWISDPEKKSLVIDQYKTKLSTIDCKWYNFGEGVCPFGTSCFYKHANADGTLEISTLRVIVGEEDSKIVNQIRLSDFL